MPKASKKKAGKEADFKKAKVKLGKGKKQPSNATDTSFKARSIALPNQNPLDRALQAPSGEPITSSGLTLDEVLLRFRHPNGGVRREAVGGLKEILVQQPDREVGKVARVLGGAVSDEDAGVRKALLSFFAWYLTALDETSLTPHVPLLLLHTSSALSHIFPEIRLDTARLVQLFLDHIPTHVISSWPMSTSTILEGLRLTVGLGGDRATGSAQSGRLGAQGKLVALRTILAFVRAALDRRAGDGGDDADPDELATLFAATFAEGNGDMRKGKGKAKQLDGDSDTWGLLEGYLVDGNQWGVESSMESWEVGRLETETSLAGQGAEVEAVAQLYTQLHPLLLATFLEAAPTAFSPSSSSLTSTDQVSLELCTICSALTELLARHSLKDDCSLSAAVRSHASDFLKRMAAWFPFASPSPSLSTPSPTGVSPAFELALTYSRLAILLAPRPPALVYPRGRREVGWKARVRATEESWKAMRSATKAKGKGKGRSADGWALDEVADWIRTVLSPSPDALAPPLTPQAYASLLSLILPLLLLPPTTDTASTVGTAFISHLTRQGSSSQLRALGDRFLMSLIVAHEQRFTTLAFLIVPTSAIRPLLRTWLEGLPKTLWEQGSRATPISASVSAAGSLPSNKARGPSWRILEFLLVLGQRGPTSFDPEYSLVYPDGFAIIASRLPPWFHLDHPTRGGIKGPWSKMDVDTQKLGLDVASVWSASATDDKLSQAVGTAVEGQQWAKDYWASRRPLNRPQ